APSPRADGHATHDVNERPRATRGSRSQGEHYLDGPCPAPLPAAVETAVCLLCVPLVLVRRRTCPREVLEETRVHVDVPGKPPGAAFEREVTCHDKWEFHLVSNDRPSMILTLEGHANIPCLSTNLGQKRNVCRVFLTRWSFLARQTLHDPDERH